MATAAKYYMAHANGGTDMLNVAKYLSNFKDVSRQQVRRLKIRLLFLAEGLLCVTPGLWRILVSAGRR